MEYSGFMVTIPEKTVGIIPVPDQNTRFLVRGKSIECFKTRTTNNKGRCRLLPLR